MAVILTGIGRGLAFFLGGFSLLNVLGDLRYEGFDANLWWIDFHPLMSKVSHPILVVSGLLLLGFTVRPSIGRRRRKWTMIFLFILLGFCGWNVIHFFILLVKGSIRSGFPLPLSLLICVVLAIVLLAVYLPVQHKRSWMGRVVMAGTLLLCAAGFPLVQMYCYGKTDYRREADAIVVFGARVYSDGRVSDALRDRVQTGCELYLEGRAEILIFSGGPGDGAVHETEAMRRMARELGVPEEAIVLDTEGLNTQATVQNTCELFGQKRIKRVMAVSHFYHLPRIKLTYQRALWEVYTVPAYEPQTLMKLPKFLVREVAALWLYYLRPLLPG